MTIKRGEIWPADLNPTRGSEQAGTRTVLVFQNDVVSKFTTTILAIPLTTNSRRGSLPSCVRVSKSEGGLTSDSGMQCLDICWLWGLRYAASQHQKESTDASASLASAGCGGRSTSSPAKATRSCAGSDPNAPLQYPHRRGLRRLVGFSKNLHGRVQVHNNGLVPSTRRRLPLELVYWEGCLNQTDATHRERYLKTAWRRRRVKARLRNYFTG
jgi:mRNA-degrading endonuclease toxin of MazEF toxin-antitoxin module